MTIDKPAAIAARNRRAPSVEETRLRAEVAALRATLGQQPATEGAEPIGCPLPGACSAVKASAAGYAAGAEAMREAAAQVARAERRRIIAYPSIGAWAADKIGCIEAAIRALPIPDAPAPTEEPTP